MSTTDKLNKSIYIGGWTETDLELMSESRLWNHVICQAISDSYLGGHHEKLSVARWVKSDDFEEVCDMAELNTDRLRGHMKQILTSKEVVARYLGERLKKVIQSRSSAH